MSCVEAQLARSTSSMMANVIQCCECWLPRTETWLYNHIRQLPKQIHSTVLCQWTQNLSEFPVEELVSLNEPPKPTTITERVYRRLGVRDPLGRHLALLEGIIRNGRPDILHSHFGHCGWINAALATKYGVPHIVSFYGLDVGYLPRGDRRWYSRYRDMSCQVDLVLCEGPHMASCIAELGIDSKKIRVFRLGVDLTRIPFVPRDNPLGKTVRFLLAGSFREKKGFSYAIEAIGLFHQEYPNIRITVIGDAGGSEREQREKQKMMSAVERWELHDKISLLGYQPHEVLIQQYYEHDIFVSPSVTAADGDTEGGAPVTIIEAAASGLPVISTVHCDIPFVLSEHNKRWLVPERDAPALDHAIHDLLQYENWHHISFDNRGFIERHLDVVKQSIELAQIYTALLAGEPVLGTHNLGEAVTAR
jgi:colanic acid/amylovoran biosynthesis glycosyltransferase